MAGLVPAIHALLRGGMNVDARDMPGNDDWGSQECCATTAGRD
jgi:hypothetical protein